VTLPFQTAVLFLFDFRTGTRHDTPLAYPERGVMGFELPLNNQNFFELRVCTKKLPKLCSYS